MRVVAVRTPVSVFNSVLLLTRGGARRRDGLLPSTFRTTLRLTYLEGNPIMRLLPFTPSPALPPHSGQFRASLALCPLGHLTDVAVARPAPDSFADLAARLLPAVVNVSSSQTITAKNTGPEVPIFPPGSPFEQFFKDFLNRQHQGQKGDAQPKPERRAQSLGSGFIIDASGLVVTNNHVIEGADEISVILQDNTTLKAEVVGRDESGDIALLRVKSDKPLPTVDFGGPVHVACRRLGHGDWQPVRSRRHRDQPLQDRLGAPSAAIFT